jgi:hypothetical protein
MKKILILVTMFFVLTSFVSAKYIPNNNYCDFVEDNVDFISPCPHDHRVDGDWFKVKVYNVTKGLSHCEDGVLIQEGCTYTLKSWLHPNVIGGSLTEKLLNSQSSSSLPQTTTTTLEGATTTTLLDLSTTTTTTIFESTTTSSITTTTNDGGDNDPTDVPEFGTIGALLALIGTGYVVFKKR